VLLQSQMNHRVDPYDKLMIPQILIVQVERHLVIQHSDVHGIDGFKRQLDMNRFVHFYKNGVINSDEFEQMKQASEAINNNSPDAYVMMNFIIACGTKQNY